MKLPQQEVKALLKSTMKILGEQLEENESVSLSSLGILSCKTSKEKKSFNVVSREYWLYPPKRSVKFAASTTLKAVLPTKELNHEQ